MSVPEKSGRSRKDTKSVPPEPFEEHPEGREDSVSKSLRLRLRRICENLSSAEFEALLLKMTREQLRGERIHGRNFRP